MSANAIRTDEQQNASKCAGVATSQTETLASIVTKVKRDSQQAADAYLEETKVPHGGE